MIQDILEVPSDRMNQLYTKQRIDHAILCESCDLPLVIDPEALAVTAAERAQVGQHTFLPLESVVNEAVWVVKAVGVNDRRIGSAGNRPVAAQEVIGWAREIEKNDWAGRMLLYRRDCILWCLVGCSCAASETGTASATSNAIAVMHVSFCILFFLLNRSDGFVRGPKTREFPDQLERRCSKGGGHRVSLRPWHSWN